MAGGRKPVLDTIAAVYPTDAALALAAHLAVTRGLISARDVVEWGAVTAAKDALRRQRCVRGTRRVRRVTMCKYGVKTVYLLCVVYCFNLAMQLGNTRKYNGARGCDHTGRLCSKTEKRNQRSQRTEGPSQECPPRDQAYKQPAGAVERRRAYPSG